MRIRRTFADGCETAAAPTLDQHIADIVAYFSSDANPRLPSPAELTTGSEGVVLSGNLLPSFRYLYMVDEPREAKVPERRIAKRPALRKRCSVRLRQCDGLGRALAAIKRV